MSNNHFKGFEELHRKAEQVLKNKNDNPHELIFELDELFHELEVQEIELEMQNEELRRAQEELEASRSRYAGLYDFAPVGYFTFDKDGLSSVGKPNRGRTSGR